MAGKVDARNKIITGDPPVPLHPVEKKSILEALSIGKRLSEGHRLDSFARILPCNTEHTTRTIKWLRVLGKPNDATGVMLGTTSKSISRYLAEKLKDVASAQVYLNNIHDLPGASNIDITKKRFLWLADNLKARVLSCGVVLEHFRACPAPSCRSNFLKKDLFSICFSGTLAAETADPKPTNVAWTIKWLKEFGGPDIPPIKIGGDEKNIGQYLATHLQSVVDAGVFLDNIHVLPGAQNKQITAKRFNRLAINLAGQKISREVILEHFQKAGKHICLINYLKISTFNFCIFGTKGINSDSKIQLSSVQGLWLAAQCFVDAAWPRISLQDMNHYRIELSRKAMEIGHNSTLSIIYKAPDSRLTKKVQEEASGLQQIAKKTVELILKSYLPELERVARDIVAPLPEPLLPIEAIKVELGDDREIINTHLGWRLRALFDLACFVSWDEKDSAYRCVSPNFTYTWAGHPKKEGMHGAHSGLISGLKSKKLTSGEWSMVGNPEEEMIHQSRFWTIPIPSEYNRLDKKIENPFRDRAIETLYRCAGNKNPKETFSQLLALLLEIIGDAEKEAGEGGCPYLRLHHLYFTEASNKIDEIEAKALGGSDYDALLEKKPPLPPAKDGGKGKREETEE
jgi:hypothetical protein